MTGPHQAARITAGRSRQDGHGNRAPGGINAAKAAGTTGNSSSVGGRRVLSKIHQKGWLTGLVITVPLGG
jgi:hypothetical protein